METPPSSIIPYRGNSLLHPQGSRDPPPSLPCTLETPKSKRDPTSIPQDTKAPHPAHVFAAPVQVQPPVLGLPEAPGVGTDPTEPPGTAQPWGGFHPLPPAQALNEQSARNDGFILEINLNPKPWELLGEPNISCRHCIHEEGGQGGSGAQIVPSCHSPGPVWGGWCPTFWTLLPVGQEEQSRTHGKGDSRGAFHHFCWF